MFFLDVADKRVYWIEHYTGDIKSTLYNGSDVKTLVSTNVKPFYRDIDIGGDYVFYTSVKDISKVHKYSGQIPTVIHTEQKQQIHGIQFYKQEGKNISPIKKIKCIIHFNE